MELFDLSFYIHKPKQIHKKNRKNYYRFQAVFSPVYQIKEISFSQIKNLIRHWILAIEQHT